MAKKDYSNWSKEELVRELKKVEKRKKYGIVWEDKPETVAKRCETELPILEEDTKKEIKTDDKKQVNILIEGDNYHALSVLNYTHKGTVDVIYIDPPYNRGSGDNFVYNDKIIDREDTYRHSKWLSFMSKRLKLAKNLMSIRGMIFISIDDTEVAQLKLLCDDIFGEENFVIDIIWNSRKSVSSDTIVSLNHNHTLFYAKSMKWLQKHKHEFRLKGVNNGKFLNSDNDPRGPWTADPFDAPEIRLNLEYPIKNPKTGKVFMPPKGRHWRTTEEEYKKYFAEGRIIFGKSGNSKPQLKRYLTDAEGKGLAPKSIWDDVGTTTNGTQELEKLLGAKKFNNPKPVSLIKRIVELSSTKKSIILDFFAGSGTTGQAVTEYNLEDNGFRKFILCTNNENNNGSGDKIAEDICYPRVKKVIQNLEKESKGKLVSNRPGGLKYYKTGFVDAEQTDTNKHKMVDKSTEMLCLKEDCFDEVMDGKNFKIFKNGQDKHLGIIYDDEGIEPFKKEAKKLKKQFVVYVFSLDESAREDEFEDVADLVELRPIPAVILNVYKRIFK